MLHRVDRKEFGRAEETHRWVLSTEDIFFFDNFYSRIGYTFQSILNKFVCELDLFKTDFNKNL